MQKFQETVDFIKGLYPGKDPIVLHEPVFHGNERKYVLEAIDSTFVSSVGKFVDLFEERIAEFVSSSQSSIISLHKDRGAEVIRKPVESDDEVPDQVRDEIYAVACVNGTAGLHVALLLAGAEQGDEVLCSPLSFIASVNPVRYCGAEPVFVDVDRRTLGMSADKLEEFLASNCVVEDGLCMNKITGNIIRACIPVHVFGHPCDIDRIVEICRNYHIIVIEDAAESIGSSYKGIHTGLFGKIGVLSFNGNKTITTGAGGVILTKEKALAQRAKHLTTQAKISHKWEYEHDEVGYNYRMPNLNAAIGVAQIEKLSAIRSQLSEGEREIGILDSKRHLAEVYREFFEERDFNFFVEPDNSISNYWLNTLIMRDKEERDTFLAFTYAQRVFCRPVWGLISDQVMYKDCLSGDLSNVRWLVDRIVNLPSSVLK
jgi:perosamine synthetase